MENKTCRVQGHTPLTLTLGRQRQLSLVHTVNSRTARATKTEPVSITNKQTKVRDESSESEERQPVSQGQHTPAVR